MFTNIPVPYAIDGKSCVLQFEGKGIFFDLSLKPEAWRQKPSLGFIKWKSHSSSYLHISGDTDTLLIHLKISSIN
jgi:hypothetical protein